MEFGKALGQIEVLDKDQRLFTIEIIQKCFKEPAVVERIVSKTPEEIRNDGVLCELRVCDHLVEDKGSAKFPACCLRCGYNQLWTYFENIVEEGEVKIFDKNSEQHQESLSLNPGEKIIWFISRNSRVELDQVLGEVRAQNLRLISSVCGKVLELPEFLEGRLVFKWRRFICQHGQMTLKCKIDQTYTCDDCGQVVDSSQVGTFLVVENGKIAYSRERIEQKCRDEVLLRKKLILLLDLDNTVLHSIEVPRGQAPPDDLEDVFVIDFGRSSTVYLCKLRDHLREFLTFVLPHFDLIVMTHGTFEYARIISKHVRERYADIFEKYKDSEAFLDKNILAREDFETNQARE